MVGLDRRLRDGATVKGVDPVAVDGWRRRIGDRVVYARDMYDAVVDADALMLLTEWKQFRMPSWSVMRKAMKAPVLVDGRNIYDRAEVVAEGFRYSAIGK